MNELEKRVKSIEIRNKKVEQDKKWETSWTRRISIAVMTYAVVVLYLLIIKNERAYLTAFVPALGYLLSTTALKTIRNIWQK